MAISLINFQRVLCDLKKILKENMSHVTKYQKEELTKVGINSEK